MKNSHDPCCVAGMYVGVQVVACLLVTEPHSDTWLEEEQAGDGDKDQEKGVLMDSDQVSLLSPSPVSIGGYFGFLDPDLYKIQGKLITYHTAGDWAGRELGDA